jgi:type IV pilus assembly protein PilA
MFCTSCGAANPDTGRFCVKCGQPLAGEPPPVAAPAAIPGGSPDIPPSAYSNEPPPAFAKPPETSRKAIGSFICGFFFWIFPAAVAGIILGHLSLSEIQKAGGRLKGRGMAVGGLVMGYGGVVAIPLILILAAIAIPNLLRSRMAANEASAVGSLRTMEVAAVSYASTYSNGFPPTLDAMGAAESGAESGTESGVANCDHAQLLDGSLASGQKSGYTFVYFMEPSPDGTPALSPQATANGCTVPGGSMYEIHADPVNRGNTGQRSFYTDQTGIIRWERDKPATADSNVLE